MQFYTTDSMITVDEKNVRIKKLKHDSTKQYWLHSFILLAIVIIYQVESAMEGNTRKWVSAAFVLALMAPHFIRIYKLLLVYKWSNTIALNAINNVKELALEHGLETKVVLQLKSGRKKEFLFRTAENQSEHFIKAVKPFSTLSLT